MSATTNDNTPNTAPGAAGHPDDLAKHVDVLLQIRAYCNSVLAAKLAPVTTPPPDWFNTLNTNLKIAQTHCGNWAAIEAAMVTTIPQALIDYGNIFTAGVTEIVSILNGLARGKNPTPDQVQTMTDILNAIQQQLATNKTNIKTVYDTFTKFRTDSSVDFDNFNNGTASIASAIASDRKVITSLNDKITDLNVEIAKDRLAVTASAIAGGVGLFAGTSMMALGAETMGVGFIIGAFVVAGAVASLITMGVYMKKLNDAQADLAADQAQLADEDKQVTALLALNASVSNLVNLNSAMGDSLNAVNDWWKTVDVKLQSVINDITAAQNNEKPNFWVLMKIELNAGLLAWGQLVDFATSMQKVASDSNIIDKKTPVLDTIGTKRRLAS